MTDQTHDLAACPATKITHNSQSTGGCVGPKFGPVTVEIENLFFEKEMNPNFPKVNLLKTKSNLLYIRNQALPRSKHFQPRL